LEGTTLDRLIRHHAERAQHFLSAALASLRQRRTFSHQIAERHYLR
jgi:hypothetical protein